MKSVIISLIFLAIGSLSACGSQTNVKDSNTIADLSEVLAEKMAVQESKKEKDSNLTCTCYGGPGNYPYACAPIKKTCYGGPGNYPYDCSVCPQ